ncbi:MAG: RNA 2',3'-cyclic phosphodiesterase [Blastocatellia bacterium]|nr:RNA 2',3'-cyclic phosphodiesterase [Blastocatellia bacterium]MBL8195207.1 RNA 2',3'-cyclic phosphodiesterase [Blastocatellia bacterium]
MNEMIRTFICIELPNNLKTQLEKVTEELKKQSKAKISWVKASNLHLTLRFLGDVTKDQVSTIKSCVEQASQNTNSFAITASGLGTFPNTKRPRVFWIGINDTSKSLLSLQKHIEQELVKAGFGRSDYPFSPHLTLGRVKEGNAQELAEKLSTMKFDPINFDVSELIVMRSDLRAGGSLYTRLATIKLLKEN